MTSKDTAQLPKELRTTPGARWSWPGIKKTRSTSLADSSPLWTDLDRLSATARLPWPSTCQWPTAERTRPPPPTRLASEAS